MSNRSGRGPQGTGHPSGTPTEEERLGLVKGDSSNALVPSHGRGGSDGSSGSEAGERAYALQKAETESLPSYDGDVDDKGSDEEDGGSSSHKAGAASSHAAPKARSNHKRQGTLVSPEDAAHLPRSPYDTRDEGILQHREPRRRNGNDDDDEAFTLHKGERAFV